MPAKHLHRIDEEKTYSHVYNKGVEKRIIFTSDEDYAVFLGYLKDYLSEPADPESTKKAFTVKGRVFRGTPHQPKNYFNKIELIAYKLTPNRFDLLLHQMAQGSIEGLVRSLCTRYSMYFNKKYQRTGALFEGPYKSVRVKVESELQPLTANFHHDGGYSSYSEYLGTRETSWVKSKVVLAVFDKEGRSYKDFVESYVPEEKENVEAPPPHIIDLQPKTPPQPQSHPKPQQRTFEFIATSATVFLLLVALGIRNIQASAIKIDKISATPTVLSQMEVVQPEEPEQSVEPEQTVTEVIVPKQTVTIKINDGSLSVNIRQKPTIYSEKLGDAYEGEIFEFVSKTAGWYEIKLADESIGFVSAKYLEEVEGITN